MHLSNRNQRLHQRPSQITTRSVPCNHKSSHRHLHRSLRAPQAAMQTIYAVPLGLTLCALIWRVFRFTRADADLRLLGKRRLPPKAFSDKVVWLTGASQGLGEELALLFAQHGAKLILSSRKEESLRNIADVPRQAARLPDLQRVADACVAHHGSQHPVVLPFDLCAPHSVMEAQAKTADEAFGSAGVDYMVHVAGASQHAVAEDTSADVTHMLFKLNSLGPIVLNQALLPHMLARGKGRIVVVGSMAGKVPSPGQAVYSAAKTALQGYFKSLQAEVCNRGISVCLCCPGPIGTGSEDHPRVIYGPKALIKDHSSRKPSKQRMQPRRVAELCATAAYHGVDECWIARHPLLLVAYLMQYLPSVGMMLMCIIGPGRAQQIKTGGSGYDLKSMLGKPDQKK